MKKNYYHGRNPRYALQNVLWGFVFMLVLAFGVFVYWLFTGKSPH